MGNQVKGFTAIELVVTVAIVGILAAIAAPTYQSMVVGTRLSGEMNALIGALNVARSEAQKRGQPVSVCPGTQLACGTNWSAGWLVLLPGTPNKQLLVRPALSGGDTITSTDAQFPQFTAAGYTFYSGTITLRDQNNTQEYRRCIHFDAGSWLAKKGSQCPA